MSFDHESTERFRIATKNHTVFVHIKKKCACGKVTTDKQLKQYKCCAACYKAAHG